MIVHARNTEGDIDTFVNTLLQWATRQGQSVGPFVMHNVSSDNQYVETKARL
jgi:8-amino-7-oxononanoate synthase